MENKISEILVYEINKRLTRIAIELKKVLISDYIVTNLSIVRFQVESGEKL